LIAEEPHKHLIAQAKNGSGKTGAFTIGSVLRVDRKNPKTQVILIVNTRELCNQIHAVYEKICKGTGITVTNFCLETKSPGQIVCGTHGKMEPMLKGRKPMDLSALKCIVVDEADVFFNDERNFSSLQNIANNKTIADKYAKDQVQYILFSATYVSANPALYEASQERMSKIVQ